MRSLVAIAVLLVSCNAEQKPEPDAPAPPPLGTSGTVKDNAGDPVVGATVYLVPADQIPTDPIAHTDITVERSSSVDEPLEDTIALHGAEYARGVTDISGHYTIDAVAKGSYFVVVIPGEKDTAHLPGGSLCRKALGSDAIAGKQVDVKISTRPSPRAQFVGPAVCLGCHGGMKHQLGTLHMNGIRKMAQDGPLQSTARFPSWDVPLAKFTDTGTVLYFYAYNGDPTAPSWKVSETAPAAGVSFTARLYRSAGKYQVDLTDVKGTSGTVTYPIEMYYGGGLYKQRYIVVLNGSRYILPFAYQYEGQTDETQPADRWIWSATDAQSWYDESAPRLRTPAAKQSFDSDCAGCHFTGFSLTGDATTGFRAHAAGESQGEMDYDGDGKAEELNVSCESCHGPGSEHWQYAGAGHAIVSPQLLTPERDVMICAACHSRTAGVAAGGTAAPLNAAGLMPWVGISRKEFLEKYVSKLGDDLWEDGKHARGQFQQASDFLKSKKYRNQTQLMSCASCHDPHGNSGLGHGLRAPLDNTSTGPGLCLSCHDSEFTPTTGTLAERIRNHYAYRGVPNVPKPNIGCADCHGTKTARSGAGRRQRTIDGVTYYSGDISSHIFDMPTRADMTIKGPDMMPIPYTGSCGYCHLNPP